MRGNYSPLSPQRGRQAGTFAKKQRRHRQQQRVLDTLRTGQEAFWTSRHPLDHFPRGTRFRLTPTSREGDDLPCHFTALVYAMGRIRLVDVFENDNGKSDYKTHNINGCKYLRMRKILALAVPA